MHMHAYSMLDEHTYKHQHSLILYSTALNRWTKGEHNCIVCCSLRNSLRSQSNADVDDKGITWNFSGFVSIVRHFIFFFFFFLVVVASSLFCCSVMVLYFDYPFVEFSCIVFVQLQAVLIKRWPKQQLFPYWNDVYQDWYTT